MQTHASSEEIARQPAFVTTHWTAVLTAGASDTARGHEALIRASPPLVKPARVAFGLCS